MKSLPPRKRPPQVLRHLLDLHSPLIIAIAVAVIVALVAPDTWALPTRLLAAWDAGVALYLALIYSRIARADVAHIRKRASVQDEGAMAILMLTILAAFASLAAIVAFLGGGKIAQQPESGIHFAFAMATIVLSWTFVHTMFTLHYAHEYYGDGRDDRTGGLRFPGHDNPDYWDFLYFALVIAMTSQVSDVAITSKAIRRIASLHGVLSFFFNLVVLALMVNMLAGAIT